MALGGEIPTQGLGRCSGSSSRRVSSIDIFERIKLFQPSNVPGSINYFYFHIIGDGKLNPIVGVYIPIIRIPIKGGMTIPNIATFDHGTNKG